MPGQKTKFADVWLQSTDSNGDRVSEWCRKGKDEYHGYCCFCNVDIKCDNGGKVQLLKHCTQKKHKEARKHAKDKSQAKLTSFTVSHSEGPSTSVSEPRPIGIFTTNDATLEAQILWLAKVASCNYSLHSTDHIGDLFTKMFPDSKIAENFKLSHTSASYIIGHGLLPHFTKVLINDLSESQLPFSVHFDETTSDQVKKQMDLTLRYWSPKHGEIWTGFYTSLFFGHAEGEVVATAIHKKLLEDEVPIERMVTLVRDGPNVNKTIFRKMNELIKHDHPDFAGLVDLGSCTIHIVHNAFGKGMQECGKEIEQLCMDLHSLFKYSAARREDFKELQCEMDLDMHNFQQHTEVRWLSIGPAIKRLLEQWEAICRFIEDLNKDTKKVPKSINYKRIYLLLGTKEKEITKVNLEFFNSVVPLFEQFLRLFQKSSPTVHILYDSMCDVLEKLMRRFMKMEELERKYGPELASIKCKDVNNHLADKDIVIGDEARKELSKLSDDQKRKVMLGVHRFYSTTVSYLQEKLPLDNKLLRQLGCLNPMKRKDSTASSIESIASAVQPKVNKTLLGDEWKVYQRDTNLPDYDPKERIEVFWKEVFELPGPAGEPKYQLLPLVVKSALVLAQTNAESERSLSVNARIVTKDRSLLGEKTIVGIHIVKEAVRFFDPVNRQPEKIQITSNLKKAVKSAHAAYREHLEKEKEMEKKKKEEENRLKEIAEKEKKEKEMLLKKKESLAKREEDLDEEEKKAREELKAADSFLTDANKKLDEALESASVDRNTIRVAKMMLESATESQQKARIKLDKIREKQKQVETKTHKLLDQVLPSASKGGSILKESGSASKGGSISKGSGSASKGGSISKGSGSASKGGSISKGSGSASKGGSILKGSGSASEGGSILKGSGSASKGGSILKGSGSASKGGSILKGSGKRKAKGEDQKEKGGKKLKEK